MEEMISFFKGKNGQLQIYDDRVVLVRKGFNYLALIGAGNKTIPFSSIKSIQFSKASAFHTGFIQFGIVGSNESRGGGSNAVNDENSITFFKESNEQAIEIKELLENKIFLKSNNDKNLNNYDEILKYKKLLDAGIINQNEFDEKKKKLLNL